MVKFRAQIHAGNVPAPKSQGQIHHPQTASGAASGTAGGKSALPYLSAPMPAEESGQALGFSARPRMQSALAGKEAESSSPPSRYRGRSSRQPAPHPSTQPHKTHSSPLQFPGAPDTTPRAGLHVPTLPWSGRLVLALTLVSCVLLALRLVGLALPPIDPSSGVQATHALYVRALAGQLQGTGPDAGFMLGSSPWLGIAPVNPNSTLPVFDRLAALGLQFAGAGDWLGRLLACLFSLVAGLSLFAVVRRSAGALAGTYAALFFAVAPLSVTLGSEYAPASLILAAQAVAMLAALHWHASVQPGGKGYGSRGRLLLALAATTVAALLDPGSVFLALPIAYLVLSIDRPAAGKGTTSKLARSGSWREAWEHSSYRGVLVAFVACLALAAGGWWLYSSRADGLVLGDGAGGASTLAAGLLSWSTYTQIVGVSIGRLLTVVGLLLMAAGLIQGGRRGSRSLFSVWLVAGLLHTVLDAGRLARHEDVLLPLLLPACALIGIGASWAGSLPARVWQAMLEPQREQDATFVVSPHTSWLLDLPEERTDSLATRPQARPALSKSLANRSRTVNRRVRLASALALGHVVVLGAFAIVAASGWQTAQASMQESAAAAEFAQAGQEIATLTPPGSKIIIAGPHAPELFLAAGRSGWAVDEATFSILEVKELQSQGALYLLSADQQWLGGHPDYVGLLADYSVKKLSRDYILFDLGAKPTDNDRKYFLESGHTLGGEFRKFWESHGGVARLGYPISEESAQTNPIDGQQRTVQYFERAVLEYHAEFAGTPNDVMPAAVGLWVTQGRDFPRVSPFQNLADRAYFPQTGHSVKEAFLQYWQTKGGLAAFGYPISEELPEISPADGKVYTVQYFERARLEWHPSDAGTADEVQLGLIGKQALEMGK